MISFTWGGTYWLSRRNRLLDTSFASHPHHAPTLTITVEPALTPFSLFTPDSICCTMHRSVNW